MVEPSGNFAVPWTQDVFAKGAHVRDSAPRFYLLNWCPHCGSKEHLERRASTDVIRVSDGPDLTSEMTEDYCTRCGYGVDS